MTDWESDDDAGGSGDLALALSGTRAVYRLADEAYARNSCPGSSECCQLATTQRQPWLWPSEWELLKRRFPTLPPPRSDGGCPFLDAEGRRCTVYEDRPFGCRTFFCHRMTGPAKQPVETVVRLSRRLEAINQRLDSNVSGPTPILEWYGR
jgi:Fe-S-cluster containining protein